VTEPVGEKPRRRDDTGLQPERTSLAWQRTELALIGTALGLGRLGLEGVGGMVGVATYAAVAVVGCLAIGAWRRAALRTSDQWALLDGRAPAALAATVVLMSLLELASLVLA